MPASNHPALALIAAYVNGLTTRDEAAMNALRAPDFVLDFIHQDAFADAPLSNEATAQFWPAWFAGFSEMDYHVTRTIAAAAVIVTEWDFVGRHSRPLGPPVFTPALAATGRVVRFRGASIYDIDRQKNLISRETLYLDLATLMVELGAMP